MMENRTAKIVSECSIALIVSAILLVPSFAHALSIKFCFRHGADYVDAGVTQEDYWTETALAYRPIRGVYVSVFRNGVEISGAYTGDGILSSPGAGCTGTFANSGHYEFFIWSASLVQGNSIYAVDPNENVMVVYHDQGNVTASGTFNVNFTAASGVDEVFSVLNVTSYGLYRHDGGFNDPYLVSVGPGVPTQQTGEGVFGVNSADAYRKFKIAHELGHTIRSVSDDQPGGFCDDYDDGTGTDHCPSTANNTKSLRSKECAGCALSEGFAHFFSADVFNSHSEADCWFENYRAAFTGGDATPEIDCEAGQEPDFPTRTMENICDATPHAGRGVQLDWMRQFWDMHTRIPNPAPFADMLTWIRMTTPWTCSSTYTNLDDEADSHPTINPSWDGFKGFNGINH